MIVFVKDGVGWLLTLTIGTGQFDHYEEVFEQVAQSFRFKS